MFPTSHTAILEIVITFVALSLRRTKFHEPEQGLPHNLLLAKDNDLHQKDEAGQKLARHIPASPRNIRKAVTQILDLSVGFLARSGQALSHYKIFLSPSHIHASPADHTTWNAQKCFEAAFIESLQTAKTCELSQLKSATKRADRGANVFVTEGSVTFSHPHRTCGVAIQTSASTLAV